MGKDANTIKCYKSIFILSFFVYTVFIIILFTS